MKNLNIFAVVTTFLLAGVANSNAQVATAANGINFLVSKSEATTTFASEGTIRLVLCDRKSPIYGWAGASVQPKLARFDGAELRVAMELLLANESASWVLQKNRKGEVVGVKSSIRLQIQLRGTADSTPFEIDLRVDGVEGRQSSSVLSLSSSQTLRGLKPDVYQMWLVYTNPNGIRRVESLSIPVVTDIIRLFAKNGPDRVVHEPTTMMKGLTLSVVDYLGDLSGRKIISAIRRSIGGDNTGITPESANGQTSVSGGLIDLLPVGEEPEVAKPQADPPKEDKPREVTLPVIEFNQLVIAGKSHHAIKANVGITLRIIFKGETKTGSLAAGSMTYVPNDESLVGFIVVKSDGTEIALDKEGAPRK